MRSSFPSRRLCLIGGLCACIGAGGACGSGNKTPVKTGGHGDGDTSGDGDNDGGSGDGDTQQPGACDLGAWDGHDHVKPSLDPPCGLKAAQVPMFVSIGFDDNDNLEGLQWALDMTKARAVNVTFFNTSQYADPAKKVDGNAALLAKWKDAESAGHETGDHTVTHLPNHDMPNQNGKNWTAAQWKPEIEGCKDFLISSGVVDAAHLMGFRTPYLEYSDGVFTDVQALGFRYDASIEEGYEDDQDGTNFYWPYTLDDLSPGHTVQVSWGDGLKELTKHPGLWELPVYSVYVPENLRAEMKKRQDYFDTAGGQITGFDYNLWVSVAEGGFNMSKAEFLATLKNSFDLHYKGNRAPFLLGAHPHIYTEDYDPKITGSTALERRAAIEEFLDYVMAKQDVKVVPFRDILTWLRNPKAL